MGAGVQGKSMGKHRGTVSSIGGKYGFIKSDTITEKYGTDVFVPIAELWGCQSGSEVSFELVESDKGKPQARNIVSSGGSGSGLQGRRQVRLPQVRDRPGEVRRHRHLRPWRRHA